MLFVVIATSLLDAPEHLKGGEYICSKLYGLVTHRSVYHGEASLVFLEGDKLLTCVIENTTYLVDAAGHFSCSMKGKYIASCFDNFLNEYVDFK